MSRQNCSLYVDANGRYCCVNKVFRVGDKAYTVTLANTGPVDLLVFPTGDTDEVSTLHSTLAEGSTTITDAGTYMLDLDCEALDGTEAPEDVAAQMSACCHPLSEEMAANAFLCQCISEAFSEVLAGELTVDLSPMIDKLCGLLDGEDGSAIEKLCSLLVALTGPEGSAIEKLCTIASTLTDGGEAYTKLCQILDSLNGEEGSAVDKLCALVDALAGEDATVFDKLCDIADALISDEGSAADKLCEIQNLLTNTGPDSIAGLLEQIVANTSAITGIETSLGQVGCTVDENGNPTGSVLVCKVSDTTTEPPTDTIKVWHFAFDGTVTEDYDGPYEGCTNLQQLANLLEALLKKINNTRYPVTPECLVKRTFCIGYDNGVTPGSSTNNCGARAGFIRFDWEFEVVGWEVNGQTVGAGAIIGPYEGWTPQLQGWADFFNAHDPNHVPGECEADFGFLPAPTWRYAKITCCNPTAKYGPLTLRRVSDGCEFTVYPILASDSMERAYRYATLDCLGADKQIQWCNAAGDAVDPPTQINCFVPCGFNFGPYIYGPTVECSQEVYNVCDNGTEPPTPFVVVVDECDGVKVAARYTLDSWLNAQDPDSLVEYGLTGDIVNCATGEPFEFPASLDEQILAKLCEIKDALVCEGCPKLIVGAAEFTTESANGAAGDPVVFPVTSPVDETSDFSVPIALPENECFSDPEQTLVIRWCFDHEIEASTNHTGFNVSGTDGTQTVGTVVGQSSGNPSVNVGPDSTPHDGPRDKYWVDIEFTVAELQSGIALQTSAFGAVNGETETIHSQDIQIQTDLSELGCC